MLRESDREELTRITRSRSVRAGLTRDSHQSDSERDDFIELKWWGLDELEVSSDAFAPVVLPGDLRVILARKSHDPVAID